jgi:hypothetical protein
MNCCRRLIGDLRATELPDGSGVEAMRHHLNGGTGFIHIVRKNAINSSRDLCCMAITSERSKVALSLRERS